MSDSNTAVKIRGCFIGIPGSRQPKPAEKDDMHLAQVAADLGFVSCQWWNSSTRPEIANSDRSFWGMLHVRQRCVANFCLSCSAYCHQWATPPPPPIPPPRPLRHYA